jgi:hypothetical protein
MRRAEIGHHHHVAGPYLLRFAQEASWREDIRRPSNGEQVNRLAGLAVTNKPSVDFNGWQRRKVTWRPGMTPDPRFAILDGANRLGAKIHETIRQLHAWNGARCIRVN